MDRISELEKNYVLEVLSINFCSSSGAKMMKRFEDAFKKKYNANREHKYSVCCALEF